MADTFRVLYADDEPDLLNIGKLFLERSGDFSVATVGSASAALELLKKEQFDAIISDYQMPGMDGIQFLIEVRKKYGSVPFILFTGKGREEVVIKALNEGADFYLQKGGDPGAQFAELINKVRYAVQRRRYEQKVNEAGEKYKAFISVSNTGAWEYHDDTGFLWCSPEYLSMLGRNASQFDFSGKANLQETWTDQLHPEDRERADRHFKEYLLNGSVGMYENHFRMRHSDGHWVWIWSRGSTLRDNKGDLTSKTVGTHIDITESRLAEEAIRKNNERLRMAQEVGKTGSWELDLATGRVWASEEGFRIFAAPRPADGIISLEEIENRIPDRERIHRALTDLVEKGTEYNLEYAIVPDDNSGQKTVHSVARILIDTEKKPAMIAGVIQDITGRKRSEEQVLLAGEEWERTFNAVPDLVSILDTEHTIRRVNKAMAAKLGVTPDEAVGLTCYQCVHGTHSPPDFCPHAMLIKDQQEHAVEIYEERLGGHFLVTCTPLWDKDGKLLGSVHIARNITDRKRAEEALLRLSQFHESVITNAQVWLSVLSDKGTILMWNTAAEEISGYRAGEVIGKNEVWKMLYPDKEYRKQITDTITRIIRDQNYLENFETMILSKSGTKKVISWNTRGIPDITGTVSDFIAIGVDVTDRVRADEALKTSQLQLAEAMDLAHLVNWEFDVATGIFTFNDRFYALYGTTTEQEGGNQMPADVYARQFVHPDDQYLVADEVNKAINATDPAFVSEVEHRIIRRDGEVRHIVVRFGITKDAAGRTVTTHGANQDITELKRIEEALEKHLIALTQPLDDTGITFEELFNIDEIQRLQDEFAKATGVASVITRTDGTPITRPSNFTRLCNDIIRKTERGCANCFKSDAVIGAPHPNGPIVQPCLSGGLWDAGASIVIGGRHIANWLIGQVRNEIQTEETMRAYALEIGVDEQTVLEAFREVPSMSLEKFEAIAQSLYTLANQLSKSAYQNVQQARFITERKRAEELISQQTDAMQAAMDGMAVLNGDQNYIYMNKAHARIYGYESATELIGESWRILYDTDELQRFEQQIMPELRQKGNFYGRARGKKKDGSTFPQELSLTVLDHGGLICIVRDITDREMAEVALSESEKFNRNLVENIPDYLLIYDQRGTILFTNPIFPIKFGFAPEEAIGSPVIGHIAPENRDQVMTLMKQRNSDTILPPYEISILKKDGSSVPVIIKGTHIKFHDREAVLLLMNDITERKRGEEVLLKINQKLNVLSQLTRKDLTNQVFVLSSYLELTKNQLAGQGSALETLEGVDDAVRSIHKTIEYTKDYQDMGAKPPAWQNVKTAMLFGLSHISIGNIQHCIETEDLDIFADPLLEKVCQRLFETSLTHGGHVTRIRIWHTVTPEGATIVFEDDGVGIPDEKKEQIFLRGEGTRASRGSLIFVREILDITGITIKETGEPGKGARFEMTVPKGMWRIAGKSA